MRTHVRSTVLVGEGGRLLLSVNYAGARPFHRRNFVPYHSHCSYCSPRQGARKASRPLRRLTQQKTMHRQLRGPVADVDAFGTITDSDASMSLFSISTRYRYAIDEISQ